MSKTLCPCGRTLKDGETPLDCSSKSNRHYNRLKYANRHMYPKEYISKTYIIFNIRVLKGEEAEKWIFRELHPLNLVFNGHLVKKEITDITRGEVLNNDEK